MNLKRTLMLAGASLAACLSVAGSLAAQGEKAKCPVAGKEFTVTAETKSVVVNGQKVSFCCANCPKAFAANPEKYLKQAANCPVNKNDPANVAKESRTVINNGLYYVCCPGCSQPLATNPANFVKKLQDPVTGKEFTTPTADSPRAEASGQIYLFASPASKAAFEKERAKYVIEYK
jgi:YHS domain-containing protein